MGELQGVGLCVGKVDGPIGLGDHRHELLVRALLFPDQRLVMSTKGPNGSRSGRTSTAPNLCSQVYASLYAATKRSNELMAETYARLFAILVSGLRFFMVYRSWGRRWRSSYAAGIMNARPTRGQGRQAG